MTTEVESSSKLLCVICNCSHKDPEFVLDDYHIFIVDLNDADGNDGEVYSKRAPNLCLRGFTVCNSFCNVNSDLYIFDTIKEDRPVFKYTLNYGVAAALKSEIVVEDPKLMVSNVPYPKLGSTKAIPTSDGKIVVLSSIAHFYSSCSDALNERHVEKSYPELFDPGTNVWKLLPELCIRSTSRGSSVNFEVLDNSSGSWTTFAKENVANKVFPNFCKYFIHPLIFISDTTLLVRIKSDYFRAEGHMVTLDIHGQGWKSFDDWEKLKAGNCILLDAQGGIDLSRKSPVKVELPARLNFSGKIAREIVLTDYVEDKECCFAYIYSYPFFGRRTHLVVDEFKYDYTQGKCTPKIKAPFRFLTAERAELFYINYAFMLSPTPVLFKGADGVLDDEPEAEVGIQSLDLGCYDVMNQQQLKLEVKKDSVVEGAEIKNLLPEALTLPSQSVVHSVHQQPAKRITRYMQVKLVHDHDIRLAQMPVNCSLKVLRDVVGKRFPKLKLKPVLIKYKDSDGDLVTITCSAELKLAEYSVDDPRATLKLHIVDQVSPDHELPLLEEEE